MHEKKHPSARHCAREATRLRRLEITWEEREAVAEVLHSIPRHMRDTEQEE
jgi:hypothetical protein